MAHKISLVCGDVRDEAKKFFGKCDRVVMPLPSGAVEFLELAFKCLKEKGVIHFYSIGEEPDLFSGARAAVEATANGLGKRIKMLNEKKILKYAPRKWKICIDFEVS